MIVTIYSEEELSIIKHIARYKAMREVEALGLSGHDKEEFIEGVYRAILQDEYNIAIK